MFRRFGRITAHLPGILNRAIEKDYAEEKADALDYQVNLPSRFLLIFLTTETLKNN